MDRYEAYESLSLLIPQMTTICHVVLQEKRENEEVKRRELAEFMSTQGVKNGAKANTVAGQT